MRNRHAQPEKIIFFPKISIGGVFWVQMASNRGVSKKIVPNIIPYQSQKPTGLLHRP